MADRKLTLGIVARSQYSALKDGTVKPRGIELECVEVAPMPRLFDRMIQDGEFDISEMAIVTYLHIKEFGLPFTAIPVFPLRAFPQGTILQNVNAGLQSPKDLEGKKIGVRAYAGTAGVWARGLLQTEYGVHPGNVTWLVNDEEHIGEYRNPSNVVFEKGANLAELLINGDIAAGVGTMGIDNPNVKPLLPDARQAQSEWFKKAGVFPMNNTVVIKNEVLASDPEIAVALLDAFTEAKDVYLKRLKENGPNGRDEEADARLQQLVGDPLPIGVEANRAGLDMIVRFANQQEIIKSKLPAEELFAENTRNS
jgi:4,5-dihydroxyphthalate decarboxylase